MGCGSQATAVVDDLPAQARPEYDFEVLPYGGWLGGLERGRPEYKSPARGEGAVHWTDQMRADESAWGDSPGTKLDKKRVLGLHVIRHVLASGGCGGYAGVHYGEDATVTALEASADDSFVVRNAATLALSTIINRVIAPPGTPPPAARHVLSKNRKLLSCMVMLLSSGGGEPSLVPSLSLLSRLAPCGWNDSDLLQPLVAAAETLTSHPSWRVRRVPTLPDRVLRDRAS